jgi:Cu-processing system permease protein
VRKRLVLVLLILSALFLGFYLYGVWRLQGVLNTRALDAGLQPGRRRGLGGAPVATITLFGMYLIYFLGSLMSVLSTVGAVSADIESGVMQSVISRPVTRAQLVAGRWLGFTLVNVLYVALLAAVLLIGVRAITGYAPPDPFTATALIMLGVALLSSLTVLGSTVFSTLANGIGVFVLYGAGFAGGILGSVAKVADIPILETMGRAATILMPTNTLWLGASYSLQDESLLTITRFTNGANPFIGTDPIAPGLLLWTAAYVVLALLGGMWLFRRRDL